MRGCGAGVLALLAVGADALATIPVWKVDLRFDPSRLIVPQKNYTPRSAAFHLPLRGPHGEVMLESPSGEIMVGGKSPLEYGTPYVDLAALLRSYMLVPPDDPVFNNMSNQPFGSTRSQNAGVCALLPLPDVVALQATTSKRSSQSGKWASPKSELSVATWVQNFWGSSWMAFFISNVDEKMAFKVQPYTLAELLKRYSWQGQWKNYNPPEDGSEDPAYVNFAMTDCKDTLIAVAHLQRAAPGSIEIYDRLGGLQATTLTSATYNQYQFMDLESKLIATGEAFGIGRFVQRAPAPSPGQRGVIYPYVLQFEVGSSTTSVLLQPNYRWIIASALQARAAVDGYGTWVPQSSVLATIAAALILLIVVVLMFLAMSILTRLAYPQSVNSKDREKNPFLLAHPSYDPDSQKYEQEFFVGEPRQLYR